MAACFDERRLLAHVTELIDRLHQLEDHADALAELVPGFLRSGKVRDLYALDDERLLLVASDRICAFDVVLPTPVPDKGRVLTGMSRYWFAIDAPGSWPIICCRRTWPAPGRLRRGGSRAARPVDGLPPRCALPAELIVRGYLSGSGWLDYGRTGAVSGVPLPAGLREGERLPEPMFTPSTKAETGHDQNIDFDAMVALVGGARRRGARDIALALYGSAPPTRSPPGIMLADTKMELGVVADGQLLLIDEVMTPNSSRFWDASTYQPGRAQDSYDKQYVRDYLARSMGRTHPGPALPDEVVAGTRRRYIEAFERITGGHSSAISRTTSSPETAYRFSVSIMPRDGILDPPARR